MSSSAERPQKAFSCIRCFERKVKCDKQNPCSNCAKSKVECIFRVPPAPRRKKKRPQEEILLARLKQCEDLLRTKGIDIDSPESPSQLHGTKGQPTTDAVMPTPDTGLSGNISAHFPGAESRTGELIVDHDRSRFIENNLWTSVSGEFRPKEAMAEYSSDEDDDNGSPLEETTDFMLGVTPSSSNNSVLHLHPSPDNISKLWQIFLDNINPMTKLVHYPTLHETIIRSSYHLDNLPRGLEALMFSLYASAVFSIDDEECEMKLGESRKNLLTRYRHGTRTALARARFMGTSDLVVLQAFILYLLCMRGTYDSRTLWTLAGVASRIAQGMGLHRDGSSLGVPPFETELRRRLWWQITILDFRSAELSGSGRFADFGLSDTKTPSNINDTDMYPGMTSAPIPRSGPTEMTSCLLRCEFGQFWKEKMAEKKPITLENVRLASPWKTSLEERDAHINELEQRLEEKFLRYCDPSIPVQFLATIIGRTAVNSMRLMAHHPRKYDRPEEIPQSEKDYLWKMSIKLLESDNLSHSPRGLKRFMWHVNEYFQWQALIYLLNELKSNTSGDDVDAAWQQVDEVFFHHPNFVTEHKKPLHAAVGSLCLKAYSAREKALRETTNGIFPKVIPDYIRIMRDQRISAVDEGRSTKREPEVKTANTAIEQFMPPVSQRTASYSGHYNPQSFAPPSGAQLPLPPPYQTFPFQRASTDNFMFPSDPALAQDLAMADMPMDWAQWDLLMQVFEGPK